MAKECRGKDVDKGHAGGCGEAGDQQAPEELALELETVLLVLASPQRRERRERERGREGERERGREGERERGREGERWAGAGRMRIDEGAGGAF